MEERSGRTTVPQIFIQGRPVGGNTDLPALDHKGELDDHPFPARWADTPVKEFA